MILYKVSYDLILNENILYRNFKVWHTFQIKFVKNFSAKTEIIYTQLISQCNHIPDFLYKVKHLKLNKAKVKLNFLSPSLDKRVESDW